MFVLMIFIFLKFLDVIDKLNFYQIAVLVDHFYSWIFSWTGLVDSVLSFLIVLLPTLELIYAYSLSTF